MAVHTLKETEKTYGTGSQKSHLQRKCTREHVKQQVANAPEEPRVSHTAAHDTNHMKGPSVLGHQNCQNKQMHGKREHQYGHRDTLQYAGRRGMSDLQQADRKSQWSFELQK